MTQDKKTILKSVLVLGLIAVFSAAILTVANIFLKPVFHVDAKLKASLSKLSSFNEFGELENMKGESVLVAFRVLDGEDRDCIIVMSTGSGYNGEIQVLTLFKGDTIKKVKIHSFDGNDRLDDNRAETIENYFAGLAVLPSKSVMESDIKSVSAQATISNNGVINAVMAASGYYGGNKSALLSASVSNKYTIGDIPAETPKAPAELGFVLRSALSALGYPVNASKLLTNAEPLSVVYDTAKSYGAYRSTLEGSEGDVIVIGRAASYGSTETAVFVIFDKDTHLSKGIYYLNTGYEYPNTSTSDEDYLAALKVISDNASSMWAGKTKAELDAAGLRENMNEKVKEELGGVDVSATLGDTIPSIANALLNALTVYESNSAIFEGGE